MISWTELTLKLFVTNMHCFLMNRKLLARWQTFFIVFFVIILSSGSKMSDFPKNVGLNEAYFWPGPWLERHNQRVYQMCILLHVQSKENLSLLPCSLEHTHKPSWFLVITHLLDKLRLFSVTRCDKSISNISNLSSTHFIYYICHQHRCNLTE